MVMSRMEMIYIDSDGDARKTNVGAAMESNAATWKAFNMARRFDVGCKKAQFILDYYNRKGDLADTIGLDAAGFVAISGEHPKSEAEYRQIDEEFCAEARREYEASNHPTTHAPVAGD